MRLIVPSFIVLAIVFYEMSGGADFRPPDPPAARAEATNAGAQPIQLTQVKATSAAPRSEQVTTPKPPSPAPEKTASEKTAQPATASLRSSLSQGLTLLPEAPGTDPMQLVSLELGAAGLRPAQPQTENGGADTRQAAAEPLPEPQREPQRDLREVIGTRVNMRDGPGTIYPVIARLNIGHDVEILADSGTGWLRLRTLPERQLGWISSSLISKPDR